MNHYVYAMPQGRMTIVDSGGAVVRIGFGVLDVEGSALSPTALTNEAATQLMEYFAGKRRTFSLPLAPKGTPFQKEVWQALSSIPYGQTRSYADIAAQVGRPKAFRAVGMANNRNPIPIVIPCHRVVGSSGDMVGYAYGTKIKRYLLELEGIDVDALGRRNARS
ncbi:MULTISPECIES: methylated-DNA--[protein]-cysteine S-methyltransferase [Slackia]|uniref:Methylated-DNA--protein-cysteine methyltransferase n=1 Tax=Slackia exigua (strain ATCC 700122 / DSM 15923 / CIP 105133 / JCM 11022 / KCTC 5966 / S-7) TaxID=649764 RepID=D0WE87_SLAES|nr:MULTISPECIES: methylated-DNA--[protein]-cysteine S-methyltransferase [Slackia]EEZ62026.1 6-O-methylguanine DNA methyltransferase, DNA binding domain protein [Slackia exigua ATCC 700122]EJU32771.1 methylated-DNA--[protein]-cysteine S-methyltransferase [Slackia sp. CM382]MCK6139635.1 methylated-DNA--[protein]-cysteine S-methyltransferase [Slackia exigua]STN98512.1 Methylated-DNA--protein-cysteine methyltransferase, constitutive [Slackia exigua]